MNWRIWHGTIKASFDFESLLRAEISKELLGADKTEITPSGIVPLVLLATVLSASYICMFISVLAPETERKMELTIGKRIREMRLAAGMSQEQLAEKLQVSRQSISKWESGRGYPSIDSLKEISSFFSVTIDELLSGEKLISIAEKENKSNLQNVCELLIGILDIFSFLLIVLPLYPRHIGNYVSAVSLFGYSETTVFNRNVYWGIFTALMILGVIKIVMSQLKAVKGKKVLQISSMVINIVAVMFLALARETYATVLIFLLFLMKGILAAKGRILDI